MAFSYTRATRFTSEVFCWATRLQNEGNKEQWKYIFKREILSLTLKERGLQNEGNKEQGKYIFKREVLSLTLKERGIHAYVACLLWQYSYIDN